jgi:capsular polysaccharide transport system permease protein
VQNETTTDKLSPIGGRPFATLRTVVALMLREMATTYGRSPGGYIWALVEPIGGIAILTIIFSIFMHKPVLGTNFALFYATAYLPFMLYSGLATKLAQAIQYSKPLLSYPAVTYVDAIFARFLLNTLTHLVIFAIVIVGIHLIYGLRATLDMPSIILSLAMAAALGLGVGTMNCLLRSQFPMWDTIWSILNRPLFIISGVLFLLDSVPAQMRGWLWYNPLIQMTGEMRQGFYPTYHATYVSPAYVFGVALVTFAAGLLLLKRYHRDILNN